MRKILLPDGTEIGWEDQTRFPAGDGDDCGSGIVVSHNVAILEEFRGKGHGTAAHVARLTRWVYEGYSYALCTVRRDNEPQLKVLRKHGWVKLANTASDPGNPIYIMGRNLR